MIIKSRKTDTADILDMKGPLKLGEPEQTFRQKVDELLAAGSGNLVIINLTEVPLIDSCGVGALMYAYTNVNRAGGKCRFFAPSKQVKQILKLVLLDRVLEIYENEEAALAGIPR
jgi:anti-sigma B factor antagonist